MLIMIPIKRNIKLKNFFILMYIRCVYLLDFYTETLVLPKFITPRTLNCFFFFVKTNTKLF